MSRYFSDKTLDFASAAVGDALPTLTKAPTEVDVVRFCAAIRNFHRFHYDQAFMEAQGQGRIIIPGFMLGNWCIEIATRGITGPVHVAGLKFRNTHMAPIGGTYEVRGQVDARNDAGLSCAFEVVSADQTVVTTATVRLKPAA